MKKKSRPLCEKPKSGVFCGPDKYLTLQEYTVSEEMYPVMELDSYFVFVRGGRGIFIINGEEFRVEPGCMAWIQATQVLTICPDFGDPLHIWVCAYDYQLLSYYLFRQISAVSESEVVNGIPVIAMEPCRGGQLATLTEPARALLKQARPDDSIASWAFRFLQSLPNMQVVLSGMTTLSQLKENIELFSREDPTTEADRALLERALATMMDRVPCTACRYCCDVCPQGLDIPKLISLYNEARYQKSNVMRFTLDAMGESELPGACLGCGACAAVCPQGIEIPEVLKKAEPLLK